MTATLFMLAMAFTAPGSGYADTFARGTAAYNAGDFPSAIQSFEQLVSEHVIDPSVFYNLANAYYRNGKAGAAIAYYERALQLDPSFENAQRNLAHCVDETAQRLPRPLPSEWEQSVLFWHYRLKPATTRALALSFWIVLWLALAVRQFRPVRYVRGVAVMAGLFAVAFGASAWAKSTSGNLAVVTSDTAQVRYATDEKSTVRFELHEGDRVTVDRRVRDWSRVKTAGGETGWTMDKNLVFVGPPYNPITSRLAEGMPQPRSAS